MKPKKIFNWFIVAAYIGFIYATLGIASPFWRELETRYGRLPQHLLYVGCAAFLCWSFWRIFFQARRKMLFSSLLFCATAAAYGYFFYNLRMIPVEQVHMLEYGLLSLFVFRALDKQKLLWAYGVTLLVVSTVGYFDEVIQFFLPNRFYDVRDIITNAVSGLLGIFLIHVLRGAKTD